MKASYHGYIFEVDSIIGKDGMEYPAQDVVFIEPDWSSFRREAAKDILCAMIEARKPVTLQPILIGEALRYTNALIEQLKQQ